MPHITQAERMRLACGIKKCTLCGRVINISGFRDSKAIQEYNESGRCQKCQDNPFGKKI